MSTIKVSNLSKTFSFHEKEVGLVNSVKNLFYRKKICKEAVSDISFEIDEGEIVGFLGPNGSGKTTTLKMLSGILYPSGGSTSVLGYIPWERKKEFKKQIGIVMGQKSQLWWDLPANESLYLNKCIYEIKDKDYMNTLGELSELLDVKDLLKVQVRKLSLGERMKMELIASLIHSPKVILLDEPTIGLDIISQKKMRDFFKELNDKTKITILLTSHYMNDIQDLCKRTIVINQGKMVYDGELAKVNDIFAKKKVVKLQLREMTTRDVFEEFGDIRQYDGFNVVIEVEKEKLKSHTQIIWNTLPVIDFNIEDIPIEEGIALLYRKEGKSDEFGI